LYCNLFCLNNKGKQGRRGTNFKVEAQITCERREEDRGAAVLRAIAPQLPSGKILMVIKCPLVTIHMPRCGLLFY